MNDGTINAPENEVTPPPVAGEIPPDPNIVGDLTQEEVGMLNSLRQQGNTITMRIGLAELQKTRLLWQIQQIEDQAQEVMQKVGKRLNIPNGQPWQVTQNGKARLLANVQGFPPMRTGIVPPSPEGEPQKG